MSHPTSLVPVSTIKVMKAAQAMIDSIEPLRRKERTEAIIALTKQKRNWWPFSRLVTQEEAMAMVEERGPWEYVFSVPFYVKWRWAGSGRKDIAESFLKACQLSQNEVIYLNLDDASIVQSWL